MFLSPSNYVLVAHIRQVTDYKLDKQVLSVKAGYWDSMYDNFLDIVDDGKQPVKEELRPVDIAAPIDVFPDPRESSPCQVLEATSMCLLPQCYRIHIICAAGFT